MPQPKLLLVEDDSSLAELLEYRFEKEGYDVRTTSDGDEALMMAEEDKPDLVILDWMIEGTSGIEVCRRLRRSKATAARADHHADSARSRRRPHSRARDRRRRLRHQTVQPARADRPGLGRPAARPAALAGEAIELGDIRLDPAAHRVARSGQELKLGPTEYRLLAFFMEHPRHVFSRHQLLDAVWGTRQRDRGSARWTSTSAVCARRSRSPGARTRSVPCALPGIRSTPPEPLVGAGRRLRATDRSAPCPC